MYAELIDKVMISMLCVSFLSSIAIFIAIPLTVRNEKLGTLVGGCKPHCVRDMYSFDSNTGANQDMDVETGDSFNKSKAQP